MSVLESKYSPKLTVEEGVTLLCETISAGILNDLGSGSNVDICIIRPTGVIYHRNYRTLAQVSPSTPIRKPLIARRPKVVPEVTRTTVVRRKDPHVLVTNLIGKVEMEPQSDEGSCEFL